MRDPERLLSTRSDADTLERELVSSLRSEAAPARAKHELWQGVVAGVAAAAAPASVAAASAAAGSGGLAASVGAKNAALVIAKCALVAALGAGAASGAYWVARRPITPPSAAARTRAVAAKVAAAPLAPAQPEPVVVIAPEPARKVAAPRKLERQDSLAAESELLRLARAQLRTGELAAAERSLQLQRRRFPHGMLDQERDVLRIELLRARGDDAAARRLASEFLLAHPESPHAAQLRPLSVTP